MSETNDEIPGSKASISGDLLAVAIEVALTAADMADRLKTLMATKELTLPNFQAMFGDSSVTRQAREAHHWMETLADYFNATDAVDDEEDEKWDAVFEKARQFFPLRRAETSRLLVGDSVLEDVALEMAAEFQRDGVTWDHERMQKHTNDRATILRARSVLVSRAEASANDQAKP